MAASIGEQARVSRHRSRSLVRSADCCEEVAIGAAGLSRSAATVGGGSCVGSGCGVGPYDPRFPLSLAGPAAGELYEAGAEGFACDELKRSRRETARDQRHPVPEHDRMDGQDQFIE